MNSERLRNVVRAVREGKEEDFDMSIFGHVCGTPACAFGHYAAREDLQEDFYLSSCGTPRATNNTEMFIPGQDTVAKHFDLSSKDCWSIFSNIGCDGAKTKKKVIDYIEDFITRHETAEVIEDLIKPTKEEQHEFVQS